MSARRTICNECGGRGEFDRPYDTTPQGEPVTRCPWCEGTGKVDVAYVVYEHGWNGDFTFSECVDVVTTVTKARRLAERVMKTDRMRNVLADGTPTVQWVEIFGPDIEESLGLEEHEGRLVWSDQ